LGARIFTGHQQMSRLPRPSKAHAPARDGVRQAVVVLAIGALVGLGLLATDEYVTVRQRAAAAAAAAAQSDGEIYTGSILFMPDNGNICRQLLFDNHTGLFTDNGNVDCERAAYQSPAEPKRWSAARVRVISDGFRQR
jgi:hypothetical protein